MNEMITTIAGNAVAEVRTYRHPDQSETASVRVANNSSYFDRAKEEWVDRDANFVTVFASGSLAVGLQRSVSKGDPLVVFGRLSTRQWTTEDGKERASISMTAKSLGHDLTYGSAVFERARKRAEEPPMDPNTGEILPLEGGSGRLDADQDGEATAGPLVAEDALGAGQEDDSLLTQ